QDIGVFLTLAEELHFARTAQRLRLAPASISQTIKKLERRFGAPLFTRTTRRVDLTPLGRQLRDDLSPAYAQIQAAIAAATTAGRGETGELRLGYMSAAVARRLLALVDTVRSHTPGVQVSIRETTLADLCGPLRRAEVNLSVLPLPVAEPDLTVGPVLLSEAALLAVWSTSGGTHRIVGGDWAMMPGCAASTGLPRRDQRARAAAATTHERQRQGCGDPGPPPPDHSARTAPARREDPVRPYRPGVSRRPAAQAAP